MIPWIFIIVGVIVTLIGVIGLLSLYVWIPIKEKFEIVYDRETEFIRARLDSDIQKFVDYTTKQLRNVFIISFFMGPILFFSGVYLGYAAVGEEFWFYKKLFPQAVTNQVWDKINEQGQFIAEDGTAYTYYILVSGKEISLSGEECQDSVDLKNRLSQIRRENTVMIIDSFAVSSTYQSVKNLLNELGIEYEETR